MQEVSGVITIVQERRFKLALDRAGHKLFLLAANAPLSNEDLAGLMDWGGRVRVRFEPARDLIAGIAHDVTPLAELTAPFRAHPPEGFAP
jgi:hypothetical protein